MAYNILAATIVLLAIGGLAFPVFPFAGHSVVGASSRKASHDANEENRPDYVL